MAVAEGHKWGPKAPKPSTGARRKGPELLVIIYLGLEWANVTIYVLTLTNRSLPQIQG